MTRIQFGGNSKMMCPPKDLLIYFSAPSTLVPLHQTQIKPKTFRNRRFLPIAPDKFDAEFGLEIEGNDVERNSQDKVVNKRGEDLLDLCKSLDLRIANGRKIGDPFGNYTCLKWNSNSVVEYLLTSKSIFDQVPTFNVRTFHPMLSDHCPLSYNLGVPQNLDEIKKESLLKKPPRNFFWSDSETAKFLSSLKSEDAQTTDIDFRFRF